MRGPFKKSRKKRCNKCKYLFKRGNIFACNKSEIYIEPVKVVCFKYTRKERK